MAVFHDTLEALDATWQSERELLKAAHYGIDILRERSGFVEAEVHQGGERVLVQWLRDSAFRFFPLQAHPDLGLTLHPFDAATNKMLALAGREEPRDWIDALTCHHKVAPLGLLAWAACGKDEGWNPQLILEEAARNARMSRAELDEIEWDGPAPDFAVLKGQWRQAWREAHLTLEILPPAQAGKAVLQDSGEVFRGNNAELSTALHQQQLRFHDGHIGGAWPQIKIL